MGATNINHAHEKVDRYLLQLQTAFFTQHNASRIGCLVHRGPQFASCCRALCNPGFYAGSDEGGARPPSSLKDWGAVPLSRSSPGRVIRGGTGVLSRFVPPLVCPAFCPAYFMQ